MIRKRFGTTLLTVAKVVSAATMVSVAGCGSDGPPPTPLFVPTTCNGSAALCALRYDEVVYATTHNAMSNQDDDWFLPNQIHGIEQQLADGIRALMLDTHVGDDGELLLCHGPCSLGQRGLVDALTGIGAFMAANRGEVITLLLQDAIPDASMLQAVTAAGLAPYVLHHQLGTPWPTLGAMVAANTRLVLMAKAAAAIAGPFFTCGTQRGIRPSRIARPQKWPPTVPSIAAMRQTTCF